MKNLICFFCLGLIFLNSNTINAQTITVKFAEIINFEFFERLDSIIQTNEYADDEIIDCFFYKFNANGLDMGPDIYKEFYKYSRRLKPINSNVLPNDYYVLTARDIEHCNMFFWKEEPVLVKYKQRSYYLSSVLNNTLFKIIGKKEIKQVSYDSDRKDKILLSGLGGLPVIHVQPDRMILLDKNHPISLQLNQ